MTETLLAIRDALDVAGMVLFVLICAGAVLWFGAWWTWRRVQKLRRRLYG